MLQYTPITARGEAPMRIVTNTTAAMRAVAQHPAPTLSRPAKARLNAITYYYTHGQNVSLTARHFGLERSTLYRWLKRYDPRDLRTLEDRASCPHRRRRPTWTLEQVQAVRRLREQYPRWGKDKLVVLLRRDGVQMSTSMVGRILTYLKRTRQLVEPLRGGISARKRATRRPYAIRKPKDYAVTEPGDLVQVDTLDVRPVPGVVLKHYTGRDMVSRWDVVELRRAATARTAQQFLDRLLERMPFPVRGIQVDGGSEFMAEFEEACQHKGLRLFVLPPRSPKLNGSVERAQRTHTEEFYELSTADPTVASLGAELREWETVYNTIRPHQALEYLTPMEYVTAWTEKQARKEAL